jgi:folate-binding protein YgfZ
MTNQQTTDLTPGGDAGIRRARLARYGIVSVSGADARAFLHAQLTNDVEHLGPDSARLAGWCSAKGRLLANFAVVPWTEGFVLVMARDLAAAIAKRLTMFVLRSKVKIADESDAWTPMGVWGAGARARLAGLGLEPAEAPLAVAAAGGRIAVRVDSDRYLVIAPPGDAQALEAQIGGSIAADDEWWLLEIRSGRVLITQATQDQFVPQMVALETIGGVDFKKGCYPGQEVVARAQYRGQLKRRILRARVPAGVELRPGQDLYSDGDAGQASGMVVNVAPATDGSELLAVAPIATIEEHKPIRTAPGGAPIEVLGLPYSR